MPDTSSISLKTTFNLRVSQPTATIQDTSDWLSIAGGITGLKGLFIITDPLGNTLYQNTNWNTPDVTDSDLVFPNIPLGLDSDGAVRQGLYNIFYQVQIGSQYFYNNFNLEYTYTPVQPDLDITPDGYNSLLSVAHNNS